MSTQRAVMVLMAVLGTGLLPSASRAEVLVPVGSTWKWLHSREGTDPAAKDKEFHTTFYLADFDDSAWQSGKDQAGPHGGFGYGDPGFVGVDIGQPEDLSQRKTAYLRLKFSTTAAQDKLVLKCQRDDGIIVYLDGHEVLRNNMPAEAKEAHGLFASETVGGEEETKVNSFPLKGSLPAGDHILAISLHNRAEGSSDLRIAEISLETAEAAAK
jgi:hypothetical protein